MVLQRGSGTSRSVLKRHLNTKAVNKLWTKAAMTDVAYPSNSLTEKRRHEKLGLRPKVELEKRYAA